MPNPDTQPHPIQPIVPPTTPEIEPRKGNPEINPSRETQPEIYPAHSPEIDAPGESPTQPGSPNPEITPPHE